MRTSELDSMIFCLALVFSASACSDGDDDPAGPEPEMDQAFVLTTVGGGELPVVIQGPTTEVTIRADTIFFFDDGSWRRRRTGRLLHLPNQSEQPIDSESHGTLEPLGDNRIELHFECDDTLGGAGSCIPPDTVHLGERSLEILRSWEWSGVEDLHFDALSGS